MWAWNELHFLYNANKCLYNNRPARSRDASGFGAGTPELWLSEVRISHGRGRSRAYHVRKLTCDLSGGRGGWQDDDYNRSHRPLNLSFLPASQDFIFHPSLPSHLLMTEQTVPLSKVYSTFFSLKANFQNSLGDLKKYDDFRTSSFTWDCLAMKACV